MKEIKSSGLGGTELAAMHMKTQGQYLARRLSYSGTSFQVQLYLQISLCHFKHSDEF